MILVILQMSLTLDKYLKLFGIKFKDLPVKVKKLAESRKATFL